ncbi:rap guanine nucleotide exchange factor 3 isoform X2 [Electrophorus electricus]|uniref:rap guanine nucleotide exchange factor 3 isoform X2 n=1 Tax=Electrophorus electricus TaxID=8005 RepID=UPI000F0A4592|nr:rap guanine nucleotide exchange factor 3 isoform X2 [Electrophorus electricus]XP_026864273.1 rap guanine nucleotide exchange factor 3 isoform X2 [Electrophorus electricus]
MCSADTLIKSTPSPVRRTTNQTPLPEPLDAQDTMKQFLSDRILKAARVVYGTLVERNPTLIRDRKHHLKTYRQCCSGKELVDWLTKLNDCFLSRTQAVGMWQVLLDEGILVHVKQDFNFHDRDTQFYRFLETDFNLNHTANEKDSKEDELQEGLSLLLQMGPDALLNMILRKCPNQRSAGDVEVIYEELLHVKAVSHLSTSVRKELAAVLVFESHAKAGTVLFSQGDKGTSWYIIWKGSVNVITHGKGLVTSLHEGEDFGQLALVNDAPRAATIILREDNCHFLRVDKSDFIRILKDVEANTVRLEEHGKVVLVLEKSSGLGSPHLGGSGSSSKYTVMSGTPEKILEHLLETIKLDTNGSDPIDPCVGDFLLTQQVFMPSAQLCPALQHHYHAEPSEGSELEKTAYALNTKQKVVKLVGQWVALYGPLLKDDPVAVHFLEKLREEVMGDSRLSSILKEQLKDRRKTKVQENGCQTVTKMNQKFDWFAAHEEPLVKVRIRARDKVMYEIYRPDHKAVSLVLPVDSSVQDIMSVLVNPGGDHVMVKMNSSGETVQLKLDATAVSASLGLNERLFLCTASQVQELVPLKEQLGPEQSTTDALEQMCSKDIATQLTNYDWELFTAMHEVELVHYTFGRQKFPGATTANLERFMRHFNALQYWVVTELCLCEDLTRRSTLLKKFIKIAIVLKEQKNLNAFFAVMFGLSNSAVQRLCGTWERVPNKTRRIYCAYERLLDPSRNHRAYRLAVAKLNPPYIPFMPLLLKDMTFIHEGNKNYTDNLVNFEKMRMIAKTMKIVRGCRSQPYVPSSPQKGLTERMFVDAPALRISTYSDQSLTVRNTGNIRHYIQNLKVIDNQKKLTQLSRAIER